MAEIKEQLEIKNSWDNLLEQAEGIQSLCEDYVLDSPSSQSKFIGDNLSLKYLPFGSDTYRNGGLTKHSLSQLCNKLGLPIRYLDKCIDSGRLELAEDNVNSWLEDYKSPLFIREYNGHIRGVLSSKYSVLDTPDILDVLGETISKADYSIKGSLLNSERLHLRLVETEPLPIEGEDLFAGIQIDSSDVGRSTLFVNFLIYKQVCTNGLVLPKGGGLLFKQKHIAIRKDDFYSNFKESMQMLPLLRENAVELVNACRKDDSRFAFSSMTEEQLKEFYEFVKGRTQLSDASIDKVVNLMESKYERDRWGLINSLTEVAQDYTLERRLAIEQSASELLLIA